MTAASAEEVARQKRVCDALMADPQWQQDVADSHAALEQAIKDGHLDTIDAEGLKALLGVAPAAPTDRQP